MIVQPEIIGGLGNQLFILFAAYSYSRKYGHDLYIKHIDNSLSIFNPRPVYWDTILSKISTRTTNPHIDIIYSDSDGIFTPIPYRNGNILLKGYFQTYLHFSDYYNEICDLLSPPLPIKEKVDSMLSKYNDKKLVCVHVRRGDYLKIQHIFPILSKSYYQRCYEKISLKININECRFLIFSDDINWCKENFDFIKDKIFIRDEDYIEFYLMIGCNHYILANSTFGWWGAYLNRNSDKVVLCPNKYFYHISEEKQRRSPPEWISVDIS